MRVSTKMLAMAGVAGSMFAATGTYAQTGAPQINRITGKVAALSATEIVLTKADGDTAAVPLLPNWMLMSSKAISIDDIKPGSYLGTTNYAKPDGTGTSTEVHVSPSGPGVDYIMDAKAGTTMTNGVVGSVVQSARGRVLTVNYGRGVRTITVPPGVPIIMSVVSDKSLLAVGESVTIINAALPSGMKQFISITP